MFPRSSSPSLLATSPSGTIPASVGGSTATTAAISTLASVKDSADTEKRRRFEGYVNGSIISLPCPSTCSGGASDCVPSSSSFSSSSAFVRFFEGVLIPLASIAAIFVIILSTTTEFFRSSEEEYFASELSSLSAAFLAGRRTPSDDVPSAAHQLMDGRVGAAHLSKVLLSRAEEVGRRRRRASERVLEGLMRRGQERPMTSVFAAAPYSSSKKAGGGANALDSTDAAAQQYEREAAIAKGMGDPILFSSLRTYHRPGFTSVVGDGVAPTLSLPSSSSLDADKASNALVLRHEAEAESRWRARQARELHGEYQHGPDRLERSSFDDDASFFMSIAQFRDVLCPNTIHEIYAKARNPRRIFAGISDQRFNSTKNANSTLITTVGAVVWDVDETHANKNFDGTCMPWYAMRTCRTSAFCITDNIRVRLASPKAAMGPTLGRYFTALMYQGESYYVMIDSHSRFVPHWDMQIIHNLMLSEPLSETTTEALAAKHNKQRAMGLATTHDPKVATTTPTRYYPPRTNAGDDKAAAAAVQQQQQQQEKRPSSDVSGNFINKKVILSHYPNGYETYGQHVSQRTAISRMVMCSAHFTDAGIVRMRSDSLISSGFPELQPFSAGGFLAGDAAFFHDAPFDPYLYHVFDGEEITYSMRVWTHGWDLFTPKNNILFHHYNRKSAPRFWSASGGDVNKLRVLGNSRLHYIMRNQDFMKNTLRVDKAAAHGSGVDTEDELYGMGHARDFEDYIEFAEIDRYEWNVSLKWCNVHRYAQKPHSRVKYHYNVRGLDDYYNGVADRKAAVPYTPGPLKLPRHREEINKREKKAREAAENKSRKQDERAGSAGGK